MLERVHFEIDQTAVTILAERGFIPIARESIFRTREIIQRNIFMDEIFRDTLEPHDPGEAPGIIGRMCEASGKADVGPMATVAGAIAEEAVASMVEAGAENAVVDNGGDIALFLSDELNVGLFTGGSPISGIGFRCDPRGRIFGICTSSGTVGPSLSFGGADSATVISEDVLLADACATALGNMIVSSEEECLTSSLESICSIDGVEGAMIVIGERIAVKGELPRLVKLDPGENSIARRLF